jgi:hypothetical protein
MRSARPQLTETTARILVHTALAVVINMTELSRTQGRPGHPDDVAAMAPPPCCSWPEHIQIKKVHRWTHQALHRNAPPMPDVIATI